MAQTFVHAFYAGVERMASERTCLVQACAVVNVVVHFLYKLDKVVIVLFGVVVEGVREGYTVVLVHLPVAFCT